MSEAITARLAADPRVGGVAVQAGPQGTPVARVTPAASWLAAERRAAHAAISSRMLDQWQMVYDRTYRWDEAVRAPNFDAWISSVTGAPMSRASMQSWLDGALAQLRAVRHARVLDIGCGVGLVLAALAPDCTAYAGIDFSEEAIASLGAWVATQPALAHVRLAMRAAHELDEFPAGSIDLVVLNSVVQYFPDLDYLRLVLRTAAARLAPGGRIFLGDLRALALLPVQAATAVVARAPEGSTVGDLRARLLAAQGLARELALDPGLFAGLAIELPGVSDIRYSLKPADADPELAGYRYDVTLVFGAADAPPTAASLAWDTTWRAPGDLFAHVQADAMAVLAIPNARLAQDVAMAETLAAAPADIPFAALAMAPRPGIHPEALTAVAAAQGYAAELRLTPGAADGSFDALLWRTGSVTWPATHVASPVANDPLGAELAARMGRELQRAHPGVRITVES